MNVKQGWSDWIQLHRTLDGGFWRFHNPQLQDRLSIYFTNSSNVSQPSIEFLPSGRVSIGVSDPSKWVSGYRLYVKEGILTEKVKVALESSSDWADYVFSPSYSLMPLDSVVEFIAVNGHLPGVPSADCMVEEGLDVAKTDAMLMRKVEELTLYVIELKKQLEELRGMINND